MNVKTAIEIKYSQKRRRLGLFFFDFSRFEAIQSLPRLLLFLQQNSSSCTCIASGFITLIQSCINSFIKPQWNHSLITGACMYSQNHSNNQPVNQSWLIVSLIAHSLSLFILLHLEAFEAQIKTTWIFLAALVRFISHPISTQYRTMSTTPTATLSPMASDSQLQIPRRPPTAEMVGPYVLGRTLGRGTTGKVKEAYHRDSGLEVAIKIVKKDYVKTHRTKISREIAVMKLIDQLSCFGCGCEWGCGWCSILWRLSPSHHAFKCFW